MILHILLLSMFGFQKSACSAAQATPRPGESSTITCVGCLVSSWTATKGAIVGTGNYATLTTDGLSPGASIVVTAICSGQPNQVSLTISHPPSAPPPNAMSYCSINFERDKHRPTRVDNEAKACLDDLALSLERSADSSLVLIGSSAPIEPNAARRAQQRAVDAKDYLVRDKGLDASRILVFSADPPKPGSPADKPINEVRTFIVPLGAKLPTQDDTPVDESKVKPISRYRQDQ